MNKNQNSYKYPLSKNELLRRGAISGDASSNTIGNIFCVAITIILAALLALMLMNFGFPEFKLPEETPTIFEIQIILIETPDYDSRIVLKNIGDGSYENDLLSCSIYINDELCDSVIETLNGHNFIPTHHYFVQTIGSMGCCDDFWNPSEKLSIDLSDGTIKKGDNVRVDIIWKPTGTTISTDEYYVN